MPQKHHLTAKQLRQHRVRCQVRGTSARPRLHLYRSNRHLYAQIIDDSQGRTLAQVNEKNLPAVSGTKTARAIELGKLIAQKAKTKKINQVVFDRGPHQYHGRLQAFAQAAREAGLNF